MSRHLVASLITAGVFLRASLVRVILIGAVLALAPFLAGAQIPQKSVMFLYSGERTVAGHSAERILANAAIVDLALERVLRQELQGNLYHYSEYIDTMRLDDASYARDVHNLLLSKYRGRPLDLIFVKGDVAVDFVGKQRASFFPEIPIVFATADPVPVMPNSTGIITPIRQRTVLETALRVQPDTRHVTIVAGSSAYDQYYVRSARAEFTPYEDRLTFTYLTGLPMRELLSRVSTLPPHSIILYMGVTQDGEGHLFLPQEMLESVSTAANAPTYGWNALGMGHGLVGGTMNTPEVTAQRMAALGLRVMKGERAEDIAVTEIDTGHHPVRLASAPPLEHQRNAPSAEQHDPVQGTRPLGAVPVVHHRRRADCGRAERADRRTRGAAYPAAPYGARAARERATVPRHGRAEPGSVRPVDQRPGGGARPNRARSARRRQSTACRRQHHVERPRTQCRHAGDAARCRANGGGTARPRDRTSSRPSGTSLTSCIPAYCITPV